VLSRYRGEQFGRPYVVVPQARGCQRQAQQAISRSKAARAVKPAPRLGAIAGSSLSLTALERLGCENGVIRYFGLRGQWPTACASACCGSTCGGNAARSARAS
jgi:hypothetical protein